MDSVDPSGWVKRNTDGSVSTTAGLQLIRRGLRDGGLQLARSLSIPAIDIELDAESAVEWTSLKAIMGRTYLITDFQS